MDLQQIVQQANAEYPGGCPACRGIRFRKCAACGERATRLVRANKQYGLYWVAVDDQTYDGPGSVIGFGKSENEAIDDLREQFIEKYGEE